MKPGFSVGKQEAKIHTTNKRKGEIRLLVLFVPRSLRPVRVLAGFFHWVFCNGDGITIPVPTSADQRLLVCAQEDS